MNIFHQFYTHLQDVLDTLIQANILPPSIDIKRLSCEPPRDESHGDISTNAAMVFAKEAGISPRDLAQKIIPLIEALPNVAHATIAGPGFINIHLHPTFWTEFLTKTTQDMAHFGDSSLGAGQRVNVEYLSANPTGPVHAGHARIAIVGDALCALLRKAGFEVTSEFYINDAGGQADTLARSVYLRYLEQLGQWDGTIPDGMYPGDYLIPVAQKIVAKDGDRWVGLDESLWRETFKAFAVGEMMVGIKEDLGQLGSTFDVFFSEKELHTSGAIDRAIEELQSKDLVYRGILEKPKGMDVEGWEPREQLLFRATAFGDDVDRPLQKSSGEWTYFAADIAYHLNKFNRGFSHMINIWGADHGGYIKRTTAAVKAITQSRGQLDVLICQIVNFKENGQPVRMSKRANNFITIRDVIEKVGKDAFRFMMLTRKNDAHLDFDFVKAVEHSKDNHVFYVQYANARCHSIFRMAKEIYSDIPSPERLAGTAAFELLATPEELSLVKLLAQWPRQIDMAAQMREPHRIAYYLYDLASALHNFWHKGKEEAVLRFIVPGNRPLTQARLVLVWMISQVITSGLTLFDVEAVVEMR